MDLLAPVEHVGIELVNPNAQEFLVGEITLFFDADGTNAKVEPVTDRRRGRVDSFIVYWTSGRCLLFRYLLLVAVPRYLGAILPPWPRQDMARRGSVQLYHVRARTLVGSKGLWGRCKARAAMRCFFVVVNSNVARLTDRHSTEARGARRARRIARAPQTSTQCRPTLQLCMDLGRPTGTLVCTCTGSTLLGRCITFGQSELLSLPRTGGREKSAHQRSAFSLEHVTCLVPSLRVLWSGLLPAAVIYERRSACGRIFGFRRR